MGKLFVSYRRDGPHALVVAALAERLTQHFGQDHVFIDTRLHPGERYPDELRAELAASDVLVAVIHEGWAADFACERRMDWVLYELSTALCTGKTVIPVLLEGTRPLEYGQVPADIAEVTLLQATPLRSTGYETDLTALLATIGRTSAAPETDLAVVDPAGDLPTRPRLRLTLSAAGLGGAFAGLPLLTAYQTDLPAWLMFMTAASLTVLVLIALTVLVVLLAAYRPKLDVVTRRTQERSFAENLKNTWPVAALSFLLMTLAWARTPVFDTPQISIEVKILLTGCAVALVARLTQHTVQQVRKLDTTWPPRVTPDTLVFRRTAKRLHQSLTSGSSSSRDFARQRQAESVYRALTTVRTALEQRARAGWRQWLFEGYHKDPLPPATIGALAGVLGLAGTGLALALAGGVGLPPRMILITLTVSGGAVLLAMTTLAVHFRTERRSTWRLVEELRAWDEVLRSLVFPHRCAPEPDRAD